MSRPPSLGLAPLSIPADTLSRVSGTVPQSARSSFSPALLDQTFILPFT